VTPGEKKNNKAKKPKKKVKVEVVFNVSGCK
jgi:hypothetical protein